MLEESMSVPSIWASMFSWCTPAVLFLFLNLMIGTIFISSGFGSNKSGDTEQQRQQDSPHRLARSPSLLHRLKSINFYDYCRSEEPITGFEKSSHLDVDSHCHSLQQTPEPEQRPQAFLSRSPSTLQRLKSINFYGYLSQEPISDSPEKTPTSDTHYLPEQTHEKAQPQMGEEEVKEEKQQIQEQEQTLDEVYSKLKEAHVTRSKSDTKPASGEIPTKLPRKIRKSASTKSAFANFKEDDIVESRRPATARESKAKVSEEDDEEVDAKADDFINKFKHQLKLQRIDSIIRYKEMIHRGSGK